MSATPDISVIIPIFNEEKNIRPLYDRLTEVLLKMSVSFELIYVNDGSRDQSEAEVKKLADKDRRVRFVFLSRNFGHQVAVMAGLDFCSGKTAVIIDADLQDPPELIEELYNKHQEGFEVVYAKRKSRKGESFLKKFTAKVFYRLMKRITKIDIPLDTGDFRIIDRKVIDVLINMPEQNKFLRGMISWAGFRQTFVEYDRSERLTGKSKFTYGKMIKFALDGITGFSDVPLRFITYAGFFVSLLSFGLIVYALLSYFFSPNYQIGWASMIISFLFIGGIIMMGIGIIGEYISRMSADTRKRPLYVVSEENVSQLSEKE